MCVLGLDPGESKGEPGTRAPPFPLFSTWRPGVLHVDTQAWGGGRGGLCVTSSLPGASPVPFPVFI